MVWFDYPSYHHHCLPHPHKLIEGLAQAFATPLSRALQARAHAEAARIALMLTIVAN